MKSLPMIATAFKQLPQRFSPALSLIEYRSVYRLLFFSLIAAIFLRVTLDSLHDLQFQLIHSDSIGEAAAFYRLHDGFIPSNDIEAGRRTALLLVALIAPGIWWLFSLSSHPKTAERLGPYIALATTHMASGFFMTFMLGSFGWVMAASFFLPLRTLQAITLIFWKQKQLEASEPAYSMPSSHGPVLVSRLAGEQPIAAHPKPIFIRDTAPRPVAVFLVVIVPLLALAAVHMNLFFWSITAFLVTHFRYAS